MPEDAQHPLGELNRMLARSALAIQDCEPGSAVGLLRAFNLTGMDYKGQVTSGYGQRGTELSFGVSFNFGALVVPGLLTAEVAVDTTAARSRYALVLIVRQPLNPDAAGLARTPAWRSPLPVCFTVMQGFAAQGSVGIKVTGSVGASTDKLGALGVDELGLELSVEAGGKVSGTAVSLRDDSPKFFASSGFSTGLATALDESLDVLTRHQVKNLIAKWIETAAPNEKSEVLAKLEEIQPEGGTGAADGPDGAPVRPAAAAAVESLVAVVKALPVEARASGVWDRIAGSLRPHKTEDLLSSLKDLQEHLVAARKAKVTKTVAQAAELDEHLDETLRQVKEYRRQLTSLQSAKSAGRPATSNQKAISAPSPAGACELSLFAWDAVAVASADADVGVKSKVGSAGASASAMAQPRAQGITFRLQTIAVGSEHRPVTVTQDTILAYRQFDARAMAEAALGKRTKAAKAAACYRTMTYTSAVVYWQRPPSTSGAAPITPGPGSGVSFGIGVEVDRLLTAAGDLRWHEDDLTKVGTVTSELMVRMAAQLRVTRQRVEQLLLASELDTTDPDQLTAPVLLVEAGFALPPAGAPGALTITTRPGRGKDPCQLPDLLAEPTLGGAIGRLGTSAGPSPQPTLDVMRVRYRLSDCADRSDTVFKLGFSTVVGASLSMEKLKRAGHDGTIDLHVWFPDAEPSTATAATPDGASAFDPTLGQERAVPPVALLHH